MPDDPRGADPKVESSDLGPTGNARPEGRWRENSVLGFSPIRPNPKVILAASGAKLCATPEGRFVLKPCSFRAESGEDGEHGQRRCDGVALGAATDWSGPGGGISAAILRGRIQGG